MFQEKEDKVKITLAGYNLDANIIDGFKYLSPNSIFTPETISAAYARISRSEKTIDELRYESIKDVESARRSTENIVFGYNHHSVAEHAVFNFDICDVSRLASEYIQKHRLISCTEKSQRYTAANGGYVLPEEFNVDLKIRNICQNLIIEQFETYYQILDKLLVYFKDKYPDKKYKEIDFMAKEDARYILPLCATSQFGLTLNARNLEHLILTLYSSNILELRQIADCLLNSSRKITPSLIRYIDPTPYVKYAKVEVQSYLDEYKLINKEHKLSLDLVSLISCDNLDLLVASIIYSLGYGNYNYCEKITKSLSKIETEQLLRIATKDMGIHDSLMREYELVDLIFEIIISAAGYGQLKRHRMTTQIVNEYDIYLGVTVPESIQNSCFDIYNEIIKKTNRIYLEINKKLPNHICSYILTNSHRRRVLLKTNLREMYHIAKLRTKPEAQWDIRQITNKMIGLIKDKISIQMGI